MDELSGAVRGAHRTRGKTPPQLLVDPKAVTLEPGKIVVKHTDDGGYFCLGLGSAAEFLRAIDEDDRFNEAIDKAAVALGKLGAPIGSSRDPFLRRLGIAVALAKDGFDPDQPRDDHGRWTSEGAGGGSSASAPSSAGGGATTNANSTTGTATGSVADSAIAAPELVPALRAFAGRVLAGAAAVATDAGATMAAGAALVLGLVVIPLPNGGVTTGGSVSNAPDLGYAFDHDTGVLKLTRQNDDGTKDVLFSGQPGADGVFRDKDGNVVARFLGDSIVVDPDTVPGYESRAKDKDRSNAGARARSAAIADTAQPKVCPDPGTDKSGFKSPGALAYQMYVGMEVNGEPLPVGLGIMMTRPNGKPVYFDDCRQTTGALIEAKGFGYLDHFRKQDFVWRMMYADMLDQAQRQTEAAGGRPIEWHFAEKGVADYMRGVFAKRYPGIVVIYTPPPRGLIGQLKKIIAEIFE